MPRLPDEVRVDHEHAEAIEEEAHRPEDAEANPEPREHLRKAWVGHLERRQGWEARQRGRAWR